MDFLDFILDPRTINAVATGLTAGGKINTAQQLEQHGNDLRAAAQFQADQLREQATDAVGAAQRRAWSDDRAARYLASETLARAAASGGGASDPTVVNLIAAQAAEGSYRRQVDLYEGDTRARQLQLQATAREYEGASQQASAQGAGRSTLLSAGASLLKGYADDSSLYQRFAGDGPKGVLPPPNPFLDDPMGDL